MRRLLEELAGHLGRSIRAEEILIHRNIGTVAGDATNADDHLSWRGFNLCILDERGRPTHYVKCRPIGSRRAFREANLLRMFGESDLFMRFVPRATIVEWEGLRLIIMRYIAGQKVATVLGARRPASQLSLLRSVAIQCRELMAFASSKDDRAKQERLDDWPGSNQPTDDKAGRLHLDERMEAELERCRECVARIPRVLQHGDLTTHNVMIEDGQIVILDFEAVGETGMPLFDLWHLLRSASGAVASRRGQETWWQRPASRLVGEIAAELHLDERSAWATLPVYLLQCAVWLNRRGVPRDYVDPYLGELRLVLAQRLSGAIAGEQSAN